LGGAFDGKRCGCGADYDDVSLQPDQLSSKLREPLRPTLRISAFSDEVLSFHVPQFPEALKECVLGVLKGV
jgi:hypothetical protein